MISRAVCAAQRDLPRAVTRWGRSPGVPMSQCRARTWVPLGAPPGCAECILLSVSVILTASICFARQHEYRCLALRARVGSLAGRPGQGGSGRTTSIETVALGLGPSCC